MTTQTASELDVYTLARAKDAIIERLKNREPHEGAWLEQQMIVKSTILSMVPDDAKA